MARPTTMREALPGLRRFTRAFWPYTRPHVPALLGAMLAIIAQVALRLLEPWPLGLIFDRIIDPPVGEGFDRPMVWLTALAGLVVVIAGLRALATYASTIIIAIVGNRVLTRIRADLYNHIQRLSLSYHDRARTGDLTVRMISDIGMLKDVTVTAVVPLITNTLILVGMLAVAFWLHWQLALIAMSILPFFLMRSMRMSRKIGVVSRKQRQREGAVASTAAEAISSIKVIQALSLESIFGSEFERANNRSQKDAVKAKRLEAGLERSVDVLIALGTAMVLWYGTRLVLRGELSPGELLVFLSYLKAAFKPVQSYAKYTARLAKASAAGDRVLDIFERTPDIQDVPGAREAAPFRGEIEFDGVAFSYQDGTPVLDNVSFRIAPGQRVALIGPSGHGKSTIASLLLRLYDPDRGSIRIDGQDLRDLTISSVRGQMSVVMQDSPLFVASVHGNIAYGNPEATPAEIVAAARLANAHRFIGDLPEGYETQLGERGATLSGGQRQRLAIARAAVRDAPILILDEPTTGLDDDNEQAVIQALERLTAGRTTLLVTHDLNFAARSDLILYIEHGRIVEQGTHEELLDLGGRYARIFGLQQLDNVITLESEARHALAI